MVIQMQTFLAHSAIWRGVAVFAGMLAVKVTRDSKLLVQSASEIELVSWSAGARSRREDELARSRQSELD